MFVAQENFVHTFQWPNLIAKNGKNLCFYEEKSLVGLTPGLNLMKILDQRCPTTFIHSPHLWRINNLVCHILKMEIKQ
jgi:hypothetical protein